MAENLKILEPQEGYQKAFLSCPADIVIGGGSAGAGKSFALLLDTCRYIQVPGFDAVIFRRITPQIRNPGGLWDTSRDIYSLVGATPKESVLEWAFRVGQDGLASIKFAHLEHEKNVHDWQGSQIAYIGFDELQQFSERMFFYMFSRNRSGTGIRPCIRATCNPDPDSWLAKFIEWWIDQETGFPIPERDGVIRYFIRDNSVTVWGDTMQEVIGKCPHVFGSEGFINVDPSELIKSCTFI